MNKFIWILSLAWFVITVLTIAAQEPVEWYVHAMVTALLSLEYLIMSNKEKNNV